MSETKDILPPKKGEGPTDPLKRLEWLEQQKKDLTESFIHQLFRQLESAAKTFKTLTDHFGAKDILKDPKFFEAVTTLGIGLPEEKKPVTAKKVKAGKDRKPRVDLAIKNWLLKVGPKTALEIEAQFPSLGQDKLTAMLAKRSSGNRPAFKADGKKYAAVIK